MNTDQNEKKDQSGIHVDVGISNTSRDFIVAGNNVRTGDSIGGTTDISQQNIKVRGVDTTRAELNKLLEAFKELEQAVNAANLDEEAQEASHLNIKSLREQMTSETDKKPNGTILTDASEALFRYGPNITGAVVGIFTTPLGGALAMVASAGALEFYKRLKKQHPEKNFVGD